MSDALQIASLITYRANDLKSGALRIWGDWFGRPHDNLHRAISAEATSTELRVAFDQKEVLIVREPAGATIDSASFRINSAERVRWEWFYYGRPHIAANRCFLEYVREGKRLHFSTNVDWYVPEFKTDLAMPAVELR